MKISIDGGSLCAGAASRFGTYYFTENYLRAAAAYDLKNSYIVYLFCSQKSVPELRSPNISFRTVLPSAGWMTVRIPLEETVRKNDIFVALNQAIPSYTPARVFSISHGLAYLHKPEWYPDSASILRSQLLRMIRRSERIFVTSRLVKDELDGMAGGTPVHVALPGVPYDMPYSHPIPRKPFFLFVGMNHPIKNIPFILNTFRAFRSDHRFRNFSLKLVTGSNTDLSDDGSHVQWLSCTRPALRELYRTATALLTASHYESFNFPVLEALSQGCPVIARTGAVVPEFAPFVKSARTEEQFIHAMKDVACGARTPVPVKNIRSRFQWRNFMSTITAHY